MSNKSEETKTTPSGEGLGAASCSLKLIIDRKEYTITKDDRFMDNGSCIQLLTQNKKPYPKGASPIVKTKKALTALLALPRVQHQHGYGDCVSIFSI